MAEKQVRNQIFVSYSRNDSEKVWKLKEHIEKTIKRSSVWLDQEDIRAGDLWRRQIVEAIEDCRLFIPFLSWHSIHSDNVRRELDIARNRNKPILPVLLDLQPHQISKEMEYQLSGLQRVEYDRMFNDEIVTLVEDLIKIPSTRKMPIVSAVLKHESGSLISLFGSLQTVGRGPEADVDLTQWDRKHFVSRRHAELSCESGQWNLRALHEANNPTFVNGRLIPKGTDTSLKSGDRIAFADVEFQFCQVE